MSPSTASAQPNAASPPIARGEKRRREIAAVAELVFYEMGFSDATMQAIAARAGASKETLYRHFGSKECLFAEIIKARAKTFLDHLDENFERPGTVNDVLRNLGVVMIQAMLQPEVVSLCRTVIAEVPRNPDLGRLFLTHGPDRVRARLTAFFEAAQRRGEIDCPDPQMAARMFIGATMSSFHLAALAQNAPLKLSRREIAAHVDEAVGMFADRYGARGDVGEISPPI